MLDYHCSTIIMLEWDSGVVLVTAELGLHWVLGVWHRVEQRRTRNTQNWQPTPDTQQLAEPAEVASHDDQHHSSLDRKAALLSSASHCLVSRSPVSTPAGSHPRSPAITWRHSHQSESREQRCWPIRGELVAADSSVMSGQVENCVLLSCVEAASEPSVVCLEHY